jgi:hypothetical protein
VVDRAARTNRQVGLRRAPAALSSQFGNNQLRTLQRHIQLWRAKTILTFDADWAEVEGSIQPMLPRPLRVAVDKLGEAEAEECLA